MAHQGSRLDAQSTPEREADFDVFFRAEYERLCGALLVLTGSKPQAEDLAQDAFLRLYERWERVRTMESPVGYLYRTALNLTRRRLHRLGLRREVLTPSSQDSLQQVEERRDVLRMLQDLPRPLREALVLMEWLGMSSEEAAAVLGIQPVSVRGRVHRGMKMLRQRYGGDE